MHKSATKCNETLGKWCKNKHGASKLIDTLETYHPTLPPASTGPPPLRFSWPGHLLYSMRRTPFAARVPAHCRHAPALLLCYSDRPTTSAGVARRGWCCGTPRATTATASSALLLLLLWANYSLTLWLYALLDAGHWPLLVIFYWLGWCDDSIDSILCLVLVIGYCLSVSLQYEHLDADTYGT
jgi:hypothetical protein